MSLLLAGGVLPASYGSSAHLSAALAHLNAEQRLRKCERLFGAGASEPSGGTTPEHNQVSLFPERCSRKSRIEPFNAITQIPPHPPTQSTLQGVWVGGQGGGGSSVVPFCSATRPIITAQSTNNSLFISTAARLKLSQPRARRWPRLRGGGVADLTACLQPPNTPSRKCDSSLNSGRSHFIRCSDPVSLQPSHLGSHAPREEESEPVSSFH